MDKYYLHNVMFYIWDPSSKSLVFIFAFLPLQKPYLNFPSQCLLDVCEPPLGRGYLLLFILLLGSLTRGELWLCQSLSGTASGCLTGLPSWFLLHEFWEPNLMVFSYQSIHPWYLLFYFADFYIFNKLILQNQKYDCGSSFSKSYKRIHISK